MEVCKAVESGQFKVVALSASANDSKVSEIPKGQFYQALADSMSARRPMLPETEKALKAKLLRH